MTRINEFFSDESPEGRMAGSVSAADTLAQINRIAEARTVEMAWRIGIEALGAFGFERVNYGYTRYRVGVGIGDPADAFFLSTHALEAIKHYHTSGLYLRSADFRWVRENVGACSWGWVREERRAGRLSADECAVMDQLGSGRQRAGYTVSFPVNTPRSKGAMALAARVGVRQQEVDAHWLAHEDGLMALTHVLHLKLSQMPLPVDRARLTARQSEILGWIADGKAMADVCILTGLSRSAVEKHLRAARDRLNVETTAHAVAKVSFLNQLFVQHETGA
ncbi:helix-turn-helix transcriptional regulator [Shimia aestuarii]|uniref:DNA-binding transcriptional regulator, CsgD family n=1 Tax=Shimia aestuarii TaxID=254406 RepID=A0A1I4RJQ7_9RHOB|nr:autoinducer binding domain-containing protein [Shimia aestuarii]SFM52479.1 DNA-binding transcriptional regulator, CsgD family [Shimia aestuarii]